MLYNDVIIDIAIFFPPLFTPHSPVIIQYSLLHTALAIMCLRGVQNNCACGIRLFWWDVRGFSKRVVNTYVVQHGYDRLGYRLCSKNLTPIPGMTPFKPLCSATVAQAFEVSTP